MARHFTTFRLKSKALTVQNLMSGIRSRRGKKTVMIKTPRRVVRLKKPKRRNKNNSIIPKGTFQSIGSTLGGFVAGDLGSRIGSNLGARLSRVVGFGSYKVRGNTLVSGNANATFASNGHGCTFSHREFISNITGTSHFTVKSFPINPGMPTTFPWLSSLAVNFEEYRMLGLIFEYKPTSGFVTTSPSLGSVVMATEYNLENGDFISKQQMEAYEFANSTVPSAPCVHAIECAPNSTVGDRFFVRSPDSVVTDRLLYDRGVFQIATEGCPVEGSTLGELWVTYHVSFSKPRMRPIVNIRPDKRYWGVVDYNVSSGVDPLSVKRITGTLAEVAEFKGQDVNWKVSGRFLYMFHSSFTGYKFHFPKRDNQGFPNDTLFNNNYVDSSNRNLWIGTVIAVNGTQNPIDIKTDQAGWMSLVLLQIDESTSMNDTLNKVLKLYGNIVGFLNDYKPHNLAPAMSNEIDRLREDLDMIREEPTVKVTDRLEG